MIAGIGKKFFSYNEGGGKVLSVLTPALIIVLGYYILSLLEVWAYVPESFQVVAYFGVLIFALSTVFLGINRKLNYSVPRARKILLGLTLFAGILGFSSIEEFSRLNSQAIKPKGLFDYPNAEISVMVNPPVYSGGSSFEVNPGETLINDIPEGSVIDVRVDNLIWKPHAKLSDGQKIHFTESDEGGFQASFTVNDQTGWSLKQGAYLLDQWDLDIIDDGEPVFKELVIDHNQNNDKGYIPLKINVEDDHKIMRTSVSIDGETIDEDDRIDLAVRNIQSYENVIYLDLTGSDYTGSKVDLLVSIEDEAGQVTTRRIEDIEIPAKDYKKPLARKLVSLYNHLENPEGKLRSSAREIKALGLISEGESLPPIYYMALRSAYWRLINPTEPDDRNVARDLLWDVAQKIENGEIASIENELLYSLDELALGIRQELPLKELRPLLRRADGLFLNYRNKVRQIYSEDYKLEIDTTALRKLYSYILAFADQDKHHNAALIVDFMRKGLVEDDNLILSKDGLGNYFALFEGRQIIDNLIEIQKSLLVSSHNFQMKNVLSSSNGLKVPERTRSAAAKEKEIQLQTRVGQAVKRLGEKISFADDHSGFLIDNATILIDEILESMKNSQTGEVARSQSELLTVMSNLKRILNKPVSDAPELQNLLKAINSQPVS